MAPLAPLTHLSPRVQTDLPERVSALLTGLGLPPSSETVDLLATTDATIWTRIRPEAEALLAEELAPGASAWLIAGHRSPEPGCALAQDRLGLQPILDLGMRLGEGSGAVLAVGVLKAAVAALREIAALADLA